MNVLLRYSLVSPIRYYVVVSTKIPQQHHYISGHTELRTIVLRMYLARLYVNFMSRHNELVVGAEKLQKSSSTSAADDYLPVRTNLTETRCDAESWIVIDLTYGSQAVPKRTIIHDSTIHGVFISARAFTSKTDFSFLRLNQIKITSIFVSQLV